MSHPFKTVLILLIALISTAEATPSQDSVDSAVEITFSSGDLKKTLIQLTPKDFGKYPQKSVHESAEPGSPPSKKSGPHLNAVLLKVLELLPISERADVDAILVRGSNENHSVLIPRFVITKYNVILSEDHGRIILISPSQSQRDLSKEILPSQRYTLSDIKEIELIRTHTSFPKIWLKSRTNPSLMKGEKTFAQFCVSCHFPQVRSDAPGFLARNHNSDHTHPKTKGYFQIPSNQSQALRAYFDQYAKENNLAPNRN